MGSKFLWISRAKRSSSCRISRALRSSIRRAFSKTWADCVAMMLSKRWSSTVKLAPPVLLNTLTTPIRRPLSFMGTQSSD